MLQQYGVINNTSLSVNQTRPALRHAATPTPSRTRAPARPGSASASRSTARSRGGEKRQPPQGSAPCYVKAPSLFSNTLYPLVEKGKAPNGQAARAARTRSAPSPRTRSDGLPSAAVLSVVIPTYNRAPVLARCLDALAEQDPAPGEVLVVDDGSTDDTPARDRRPAPGCAPCGVRTAAARRPRTPASKTPAATWSCSSTTTCWPRPAWSGATSPTTTPTRSREEALLGLVTWAPEIHVTRHMHWLEHGGPLFAYDEIDDPDDVTWKMLYTANVSLKREFVEPFDPELPIFEDSEMAYRLARRGLRLRYDAEARRLAPARGDAGADLGAHARGRRGRRAAARGSGPSCASRRRGCGRPAG